jgi:hypothetical protein
MIQQEPDILSSQQLVNKWGDRRNLPTDADLDEVMESAQDLQMAITTRMEALNNLTDVLKEAAKEWGPVLIGHKYQAEIEDGRIAIIKPADNTPDPDSEADPDPDPDPDIETGNTGNTGPGFNIIFSGPDDDIDHKPPMTPPNPMALGACQNNFVELVAAGFIDIPEWANESKETMAAFVHQGRDVFYRGVNQQPVEMPQFCYYHRKQRIQGNTGQWGHSMEDAEFAPAPDWETEDGEGKRYCMKSQ